MEVEYNLPYIDHVRNTTGLEDCEVETQTTAFSALFFFLGGLSIEFKMIEDDGLQLVMW